MCDPHEEHVLFPYTGFSIQRQYTLSWPPLHHVRLTHCDHGRVDMDAYAPAERGTDMVWATNMCVSPTMCYRAVRRKKYVGRDVNLYIPHMMVGGLFLCPGSNTTCTNENATPVHPLLADRSSQQWVEFPLFKRIVQRVPAFYTPDALDPRYAWRNSQDANHLQDTSWASKLDINEDYHFSAREELRLSHALNKALSWLKHAATFDQKYIFWEQDLVYNDLARDGRQGGTKALAALHLIHSLLLKMHKPDMANKLTFLLTQLDDDLEESFSILHSST